MWSGEEKVYYYPQYGDDPYQYARPQYARPVPPKGLHFSKKELQELGLAMGVLIMAFTVLQMNRLGLGSAASLAAAPGFVLVSTVAVFTGFFMHEMGHKYTAQKYGCWAEFRAWKRGLLLAVVTSFIGFLFAAPGAVYIRGNVTMEENGKISAAGPGMNLLMVLVMLPVALFVPGFFGALAVGVIFINTILGLFNLIPFGQLDGAKIWRWNKMIYLGLALSLVATFILVLSPSGL